MSVRFPKADKEDLPALLSVLMDSKDGDTERHEVAELLKRSHCADLPDALVKVLDNPAEGPRFRAFAMQHLGELAQDASANSETREKLVAKMQSSLADKHFTVRCQALQNLCRLKDPKGSETAIKWLADYKPSCIGADGKPADADFERASILNQAIRCAKDLDLKDQIPTIRKYSRDPNEVVRIAAIVVLSQWGDEESRPAFEEAAKSPSLRLQRCGRAALDRLDKATPAKTQTEAPTGRSAP